LSRVGCSLVPAGEASCVHSSIRRLRYAASAATGSYGSKRSNSTRHCPNTISAPLSAQSAAPRSRAEPVTIPIPPLAEAGSRPNPQRRECLSAPGRRGRHRLLTEKSGSVAIRPRLARAAQEAATAGSRPGSTARETAGRRRRAACAAAQTSWQRATVAPPHRTAASQNQCQHSTDNGRKPNGDTDGQ
jgi:hypothetical protein